MTTDPIAPAYAHVDQYRPLAGRKIPASNRPVKGKKYGRGRLPDYAHFELQTGLNRLHSNSAYLWKKPATGKISPPGRKPASTSAGAFASQADSTFRKPTLKQKPQGFLSAALKKLQGAAKRFWTPRQK